MNGASQSTSASKKETTGNLANLICVSIRKNQTTETAALSGSQWKPPALPEVTHCLYLFVRNRSFSDFFRATPLGNVWKAITMSVLFILGLVLSIEAARAFRLAQLGPEPVVLKAVEAGGD